MEDYKEEIQRLLLEFFSPQPLSLGYKNEKMMTTLDVLQMLQGVIPYQPINQHDVYEVMKLLKFQVELFENQFYWKMYPRL